MSLPPPDEDAARPSATVPWAKLWPPIVLVLVLALALLTSILVDSMGAFSTPGTSDDGYYLRYMARVRSQGVAAFPELFDLWNGSEKNWIYPPPSRVGFIVVCALWSKVFGVSLGALQKLSLASHLLLVVLSYIFARRRFGDPRALFIAVSIGFSPLLMGLSRTTLMDSFGALCMATTVWAFLELVDRPTNRWRAALFMSSLAFMVLVKELSVLLVVPFAAFLLFERFILRVRHDLFRFAVYFVVPALVAVPIFVLAAGGVGPLLRTAGIVLSSPGTNRYAIFFGSGPWFRAIFDYLLFSPWPTLLAIGWFFVQALRLRSGSQDRDSVLLAVVAASLILLWSFFTKNIRYTVVLEIPIRVFAVLFLVELLGGVRKPISLALTVAAVALLAWLDWRTFQLVWVDHRAADPVTYFLANVLGLVPAPARAPPIR